MRSRGLYEKGEAIGAYVVEEVVAVGRTSIVYEARPHPELRADLLKRGIQRVALKLALPDPDYEDRHQWKKRSKRLEREFKVLSERMAPAGGHPNVVQVYEFGWHQGLPWFAMEWVEGPTLAEALHELPRLGEMMWVFGHLCAGVAFLHYAGICHRDLKPANVMLRKDGGHPVLIDFGICQPPLARTLTLPGEWVGTPAYASPERVASWFKNQEEPYRAEPTDDVWALGVMLYEILTGRLPWKARPGRYPELMREILEATPVHPSDVNEKVPRALGDVVMKALEKNCKKRFANAGELLRALGGPAEQLDSFSRIPERASEEWEGSGEELAGAVAQRAKSPASRTVPPWRPALTVALVAVGVLLLLAVGALLRGGNERDVTSNLAQSNSVLAHAVDNIAMQCMGGAENVPMWTTRELLGGLKMPEKPDPRWIRPGADGVCRSSRTGERLRAVIFRGACFSSASKANPKWPCPEGWFDAPPEAQGMYRDLCYSPLVPDTAPRSANPGQ